MSEKENRCPKCNKLLFLGSFEKIEIKCSRCKHICTFPQANSADNRKDVMSEYSRKHLSEYQRFELKKAKADILAKQGRDKISQIQTERHAANRGEDVSLSITDKDIKPEPHDTRKIIADELNWSTGKKAFINYW